MPRYDGPIVDTDVHHTWYPHEIADYFPTEWRDYVASDPGYVLPRFHTPLNAPNGGHLLESYESGFTTATDYEVIQRVFLDRYPFYRVLLTFNVGQYGSHLNPEFAVAAARAANDWNIDKWLDRDDRFYSVIVVSPGQPEEAAKEIRRVGGHDRLVAVNLSGNVLGRPWGDPIYDPIYRAASEMGLHVALHWGTGDGPTTGITAAAAGHFGNGTIFGSQYIQQGMTYIASFVTNGTFERFPELKVIVNEYGVAWLPWLLTELDNHYELMKLESSWVKRWPSEYFRAHIRLATQPLEESPKPGQLLDLLGLIDGIEDLLCFSTDYPHWTADEPHYVARLLPKEWHRKIFCDNACDFFGWERPPETPAARRAPATSVR
jgi:predicted TIM-barrel fold metal-dependent hydrolase